VLIARPAEFSLLSRPISVAADPVACHASRVLTPAPADPGDYPGPAETRRDEGARGETDTVPDVRRGARESTGWRGGVAHEHAAAIGQNRGRSVAALFPVQLAHGPIAPKDKLLLRLELSVA